MHCFLCRQRNAHGKTFRAIDTTFCPSSKKDLRSVIAHVAEVSNIELHIPPGEYICNNCFFQIAEYDNFLVKTVRKKEELTQLIEKALVYVDSDFEEECEADIASFNAELNDLSFLDDLDVSDSEINEAMREAAATKKRKVVEEKKEFHLMQFQCELCTVQFKSKSLLQKHMTQNHKKFSCDLCDYSHRNEDYVILHKNLHEGRSENQCRYCDKEFTTKISTIRHMEAHLDTKKYQCDKCGLCFSQTTVLYNHKLQHEAEEKPLRCEICNQMFKTKRTYRHHLITHQADRPRYACEICNRTFTEKYTLKVHKRTHHEEEPTIKKENLTQHNNEEFVTEEVSATETIVVSDAMHAMETSVMNADNKFCCIICDQPFSNREQMNKHMEKDHDVILKSLAFNNYNSQYEVASNETKKTCHICGQIFSNLDYHLESVHGLTFK